MLSNQMMIYKSVVSILVCALLIGCQPSSEPSTESPTSPESKPQPNTAVAPLAPATISGWQGRWQGVEGTYLELKANGAAYQVTIQDLDTARTFVATVTAQGLRFERDGQSETIQAADGAATGMKWLTDKKDCLVIRVGEGFCRD